MKTKDRMILISVLILFVVAAWVFSALFFNAYSYGMSPIYDISPNYKLVGNCLWYYPDPNYLDDADWPVDDPVQSFRVKNNWFIGMTEKGYMAVDLERHEIYYPLNTIEEVVNKIGIDISPKDWPNGSKEKMDSKYLRRYPAMIKALMITNYLFGSILSILLAIMLYLLFKIHLNRRII